MTSDPIHIPTPAANAASAMDVAADPRVERTRQAVVAAGVSLLLEGGPDAINHAALAAGAGVSRTTLYKYWPTRAKLLVEVLSAFDAHPRIVSSGDLRADLLALLRELQTSMSDPTRRRVFSSMLAQMQWDEELNEAHDTLRAIPLAGFERLLDDAVERGQLVAGVATSDAACRLIGPLMFAALVNDDAMAVDVESIVDDWLATVRP